MTRLQQKPIVHGRDHMPGAPDPIPGFLTAGSGVIYSDYVQTLGPIGYWRLGETGTPWADTSGIGGGPHDMSQSGSGLALTADVTGALPAGQDDGAVQFNYDGTSSSGGKYLATGSTSFFVLNPMTAAAFVKTSAVSGTRRGEILGSQQWAVSGGGFRQGWALQATYPSGYVRFGLGQPAGNSTPERYAESPGPLVADTWYHIAGTYDGTNIKLYLNGELVTTTAYTDASTFGHSGGVRIGYQLGNFENFWLTGSVDEAAVWNICLTADEIALLASAVDAADVADGDQVLISDGDGGSHWGQANGNAIADGSIVDRHVASGADIDPLKLDHPGGTTSFLRADGTWATPSGGGGNVGSDTIWDAKGDLAAASAADTAARLAVGSNDQVLVADSSQTLGIKWAAVPGTSAFVPVSTIDAKGDLLVGTANDALDNLTVGSNNQVLTADSAQTMGVKWATPASGAVATDAIWDTKGDLAVASGADAASKLAAGSNDQVLTADSAQTLGVKWATPASSGAWVLLSTTTLGSNGTIDVTSISGSYNDLILVLIARDSTASGATTPNLNINNDSGANYYHERAPITGTAAVTGAEAAGGTAFTFMRMTGNSSTAGLFSTHEIVLYGYASTTWKKNAHAKSFYATAAGSGGMNIMVGAGFWNNSAAINRVTFTGTGGGNLLTASTLRIYGRL